jgi:Uma2 family endonuclease
MSVSAVVRFTYSDYLNLPEESRYEILDGDLIMSPSPTARHQEAVLALAEIFRAFVREHSLGRVFVAPLDVVLSDTDVVQPDVLFVSRDRERIIEERGVMGAPDMVVEVLSPATAERDRTVKAKLYARAGVKELWLVDPETKTIEVLVNGSNGFTRLAIEVAGGSAASVNLPGLTVSVDGVLEK